MPADPPPQYGTLARRAGGGNDPANLAFLKGKAALEREDLKLAEVNFAQALHLNPDHAQAMIYLLYAQLRRRPTLRAVEGLEASLRLAPQDPVVLRIAAKVEVMLDHAPKAIALLERARSIDPTNGEIHAELASEFLGLRKRAECEAALKEAIRLAPQNPLALQVRDAFAKVFFDAQAPVAEGEKAPRPGPETALSRIADGRAAMAKGETALGYWHLREAIRLNPRSIEAKAALEAALTQRFPAYAMLCRLSRLAIQWRAVTSFVLVYGVVKLFVFVPGSTLPGWAAFLLLALDGALLASIAGIIWPMQLSTLALRFHPIGKAIRTRTDRVENAALITVGITGLLALAASVFKPMGLIAEVALGDYVLFLLVMMSAMLVRNGTVRGIVSAVVWVLWAVGTPLAAFIVVYSLFAKL